MVLAIHEGAGDVAEQPKEQNHEAATGRTKRYHRPSDAIYQISEGHALHRLLEDVLDKMANVVVKSIEKSDSRELLGSGVDGREHAGHRRHQAN